jgi:repressor LexA
MGRTPPGQTRRKVLRFMEKRLSSGRPPTVREVQEAFGFKAVQTAMEHLKALVIEGRLIHEKGKARGFRLPARAGLRSTPIFVPLLGRVPAGPFDLAVEDLEGTVPIEPRGGRSPDEFFGLRVFGESMRDAGILSGDVVIVRRLLKADPGDIVVALVGEEATVKRLRTVEGRIELHPENPSFEPIRPDPRELVILGKVIEVRRYLEGPVA